MRRKPITRKVEGLSQWFNDCVGYFPRWLWRGDGELRMVAPEWSGNFFDSCYLGCIMHITILRARIIAIIFMAGVAWSEGRVPDVQAESGVGEAGVENGAHGLKEVLPAREDISA